MIRALLTVLVLMATGIATGVSLGADSNRDQTSSFFKGWLDAIVSIEISEGPTSSKPIGTGFLVLTGTKHLVLVTARHVVVDKTTHKIRTGLQYRRSDLDAPDMSVSEEHLVDADAGGWFFSPKHDLACRLIGWSLDIPSAKAIPVEAILRSDQLQVGAPLLVLGFPVGLRSITHKRPIARSGIVARVDEDGVIVETFVFPGNSGGPVVYAPPLKLGRGFTSRIISEEKLVGIVSNYIPYQDIAISPRTERPRVVFEENSGLSQIIPAETILELISQDDFKKQEERLLQSNND